MSKTGIVFLIIVALGIGVLVSFSGNLTTYDSVGSAIKKKNKFVHLIVRLDTSEQVFYHPLTNPNLFIFYAMDSLGMRTKVIYNNAKPTDIEKSTRLVLKGKMRTDYFECQEILMKCPSKYKDENYRSGNNNI